MDVAISPEGQWLDGLCDIDGIGGGFCACQKGKSLFLTVSYTGFLCSSHR